MIRERREVVKLYASERERVKKRRPATKRARKRRDSCCALPMSSFSLPSFSSAFVYSPLSDARAVAFCDQARRPPHMYESRRGLSSKILSRTVRVHRSMRALSLSHRSARASPPTHSPEGCEITTCQCLIGYVVASVRGASEGGRGGFCCSAGCPIGVLGAGRPRGGPLFADRVELTHSIRHTVLSRGIGGLSPLVGAPPGGGGPRTLP